MTPTDDFTATVEGAAYFEATHYADDYDDHETPDLDERPCGTGGRTYGPADHTCKAHPGLTCHVCQREGVYDR